MNSIDIEYNNCYDAAKMELSRENQATREKIDALVRAGLWVIKANASHYCPFTDAYVGERLCIVDISYSPRQAMANCESAHCWYVDQFGSCGLEFDVVPKKRR